MHTMCSREIFTKKCRQQQIFDADFRGAWHYNHVTFTPIDKNFMLYCRLIYMLSILCVRLTIKVKVGIPESFKVGWYPPKKTGSSHLKWVKFFKVKTTPFICLKYPRKKSAKPTFLTFRNHHSMDYVQESQGLLIYTLLIISMKNNAK